MSRSNQSEPGERELSAAYAESVDSSAKILNTCIEQNRGFFEAHRGLFEKVNERLQRGGELAAGGNYRAASFVQRHAIDLILQEDHTVFKQPAGLTRSLLEFRERDEQLQALAQASGSA